MIISNRLRFTTAAFVITLLSSFATYSQTQVTIANSNGQPQNFRILKQVGRGGVGTLYLVNPTLVVKRFKDPSSWEKNIKGNVEMARILSLGADKIHLMPIEVHEASFDGGNKETVVTMPYMANSPTFGGDFDHRVTEASKIFKHGLRAVFEINWFGFCHCDIKISNFLRHPDAGFYVLSDFDRVTPLGAKGPMATPSYLPPDFSMTPKASLDRDLYALATTVAEVLTGEEYHIFLSVDDVERMDLAVGGVFKNRDLLAKLKEQVLGKIRIENRPAALSLFKFAEALFHFYKSEREKAVLQLLEDREFDSTMKRTLEPLKEKLDAPPVTLPVRACRPSMAA